MGYPSMKGAQPPPELVLRFGVSKRLGFRVELDRAPEVVVPDFFRA